MIKEILSSIKKNKAGLIIFGAWFGFLGGIGYMGMKEAFKEEVGTISEITRTYLSEEYSGDIDHIMESTDEDTHLEYGRSIGGIGVDFREEIKNHGKVKDKPDYTSVSKITYYVIPETQGYSDFKNIIRHINYTDTTDNKEPNIIDIYEPIDSHRDKPSSYSLIERIHRKDGSKLPHVIEHYFRGKLASYENFHDPENDGKLNTRDTFDNERNLISKREYSSYNDEHNNEGILTRYDSEGNTTEGEPFTNSNRRNAISISFHRGHSDVVNLPVLNGSK